MSDQEKKEELSGENKLQKNNENQEQNPQQENSPVQNANQNPEHQIENQNQHIQVQQEQQEQQNQEVRNNPNNPPENDNQNQNQQNDQLNQDINQQNEVEQNDDQEDLDENEEQQEEQEKPLITQINKNIVEKEKKNFNKRGIEDIQCQIQEMAKKIEHEKIKLRITTERLTQKEKTYNELQGKPVQKTNEEKEKERKEHKKAVKNHKLSDPIIRKKGKEKEFYDEQIRIQKIYDKNKTDFEKLTCDINELVIGNKDLKQQIIDLRKRKVEAIKQLETIMKENNRNQEKLNDLLKGNKNLKDQIKYKEYKEVIEFGNTQEKNFETLRDDYEDQYHELIKQYVKREKETKKENAKKRQMALLGSGSPTHFKGMSDKDVEKQIKMLAEEEISDRTPILDLEIEKWTEINKSKKNTIDTHYENCVKIEEAFQKLTNILGLDDFSELPTLF